MGGDEWRMESVSRFGVHCGRNVRYGSLHRADLVYRVVYPACIGQGIMRGGYSAVRRGSQVCPSDLVVNVGGTRAMGVGIVPNRRAVHRILLLQ